MISFSVNEADRALIEQCAQRAMAMDVKANAPKHGTLSEWKMDFTACHANGCPLDLERLAKADDFNFAHDAFGIARHLDRDSSSPTAGQLLDFFRPRHARH